MSRYETESLDLRLADCMDVMREFPDGHFDLAIVDPPYGIGIDKDFGKSAGEIKGGKTGFCKAARTKFHFSDWDKSSPHADYFIEIARVSNNQIVWGANHFGNMPPSPCWIVWDKHTNGFFADCELAWASFGTAVRRFSFTWNGLLQGDMKNKEKRIHPTQKPVALYKWLLANYAKPGQRIIDTHLGSGSHAIACHYFGVHLTACEIDPDYFSASIERIERETRQLDFLTP
jgi:site-specific DNA-methyltransferase (adenine-specific)